MIAAWSVDRLARSLQHLLGFLGEVNAAGVDLYLHQRALDTSTPTGKAMFQICDVLAEFERAMIVEKVNAGLKRARAAGTALGRPRIATSTEASIRKALAKGDRGILKIAAEFGVGSGTVQRVKAEMATASDQTSITVAFFALDEPIWRELGVPFAKATTRGCGWLGCGAGRA